MREVSNAASRPLYPDYSNYIRSHMSMLPRNGASIHASSLPTQVQNAIKDFTAPDGSFGIDNSLAYTKALQAQKIANADEDKTLSPEEQKIYNALNVTYGTPEISGVKFDNQTLSKIKHISQNKDGCIFVELEDGITPNKVANLQGLPNVSVFSQDLTQKIAKD